jgi:LysM repeat protein
LNLHKLFFTENACYKAGKKMTVKGICVHSTGVNNPRLCRYIGPDDGLLGKNQYGNHWNTDKPGGRQVCVHGFIGKLADGSIATYQTLPWDMRGWHGGSGAKGSVNDGWIGFEICEDGLNDRAYFEKVYREAVELCAYLCREYGLQPEYPTLICHSEAHKLGMASNHADVLHWWPRHGKNMDDFCADVKAAMGAVSTGEGSVATDAGEDASGGSTLPTPEPSSPDDSDTPATAATPTAPTYEVYTVIKGDTLWKIAAAKLGNGAHYKEIKTLNGLSGDTIYPGQKLKIPQK